MFRAGASEALLLWSGEYALPKVVHNYARLRRAEKIFMHDY